MMDTREYVGAVNRKGWGAGPWDGEPDKVQWPDPDTGLPCLAVRNALGGHWCGYVGVPPGHPMHGGGSEEESNSLDAHGGVNYGGLCVQGPEAESVCHVPGPGEPADVWWLGFDCAHGFDFCPGYAAVMRMAGVGHRDETYRTLDYVKRECGELARQLATMGAT